MPVLLPDQIDDFVNLTLDRHKKRRWIDVSLDYQEYFFARRLAANKKTPERGGVQLNWKVQHTNTGTARHSELYDVDVANVKDLSTEAKVPWTKQTVNFSYDVDEDLFQADDVTIVREIVMREHSMYNDFFELMEEAMWTAPTSSTESPRTPYGIPFWIQKDATTTPKGGFNGGDPSGFTAGAGGLATATYPNWKNWAFGYTGYTRDGLIARLRKAMKYTKFRAPRPFQKLEFDSAREYDFGCYTTFAVVEGLEKRLEERNDNLGPDVGVYMDAVVVKGNPIEWVPYLTENDSTDPIYGVNWKSIRYFFQKGRNMKRWKPAVAPGQHTVRRVNMDNWGNWECLNRRLCFVGSTS
jgi:hypothetical protein